LLPKIGHDDLVQGGQTFESFRERQHDEKINEGAKRETGNFLARECDLALLSTLRSEKYL
jgi:hypothetical protein